MREQHDASDKNRRDEATTAAVLRAPSNLRIKNRAAAEHRAADSASEAE